MVQCGLTSQMLEMWPKRPCPSARSSAVKRRPHRVLSCRLGVEVHIEQVVWIPLSSADRDSQVVAKTLAEPFATCCTGSLPSPGKPLSWGMRLRGLGLLLGVIWLWTSGCGSADDRPCGPPEQGLKCASDEVCVTKAAQQISYACAANPCGDRPLDCGCAASVCGSRVFECGTAKDHAVSCVCPLC